MQWEKTAAKTLEARKNMPDNEFGDLIKKQFGIQIIVPLIGKKEKQQNGKMSGGWLPKRY